MALANRLVGNQALAAALESTLTGMTIRFVADSFVAITGAVSTCTLNGNTVPQHRSLRVQRDDILDVGAAQIGVRSYLAFAGGLVADVVFDSASTYLPAEFGGFQGRALAKGDVLATLDSAANGSLMKTPPEFQPAMQKAWTLRAGRSVETLSLVNSERLFTQKFGISSRNDRMGIKLEGERFETRAGGEMPSVPVFPGSVQCPQDGSLFILGVDSGTTGGYPRVAKIARLDLHMLGQLRPGNSLRFIERKDEDAARELKEKHAYWQRWLPDVANVI